MCKHGDTVIEWVRGSPRDIDRCIAPLIVALNREGFTTLSCCCGHGRRPGYIGLADGRFLVIARDLAEGRKIGELFPLDIHGEPTNEQPRGSADRNAAMSSPAGVI